MDARESWLEVLWPSVLGALPPPPATVVEVGCGRHGGFVPALLQDGYHALGIDPVAPDGASFLRAEFESSELPERVHAIIACTSLHHLADPALAVAKMADGLTPGGILVIVEWDWESFDEPTAQWCFERLDPGGGDGWLYHQRQHWLDSQQPWEQYMRSWATREHIHSASVLLAELDRRFDRVSSRRGPYFFGDLAGTTEADERRAIGDGRIRPTRIDYVGRLAQP